MAFVNATFSAELTHLLLLLFASPQNAAPGQAPPTAPPTVHDAVALVSGRMLTRMAQTQLYNDALLHEFAKESENGRLFRLVAKLAVVTGREVPVDADWRASADRELLSLFHQTVFHAVDADGVPVVDLAAMVSLLNKLDVGHEGRVLLSGAGDGALLLASFQEIKAVLETRFHEIAQAREAAAAAQQQQ